MNKKFFALWSLVLLLSWIAACGPRRSANEKRYDLKGKVVAVDKTARTATIAHEEIKGYMPAMTMPFSVKDDSDLEIMKPGDLISTTLVVDGPSVWIQDSAITEGAPPGASDVDVPGEPKAGDAVPDFGLLNQDGKRIHLTQYRGKALALTFVYTRCPLPNFCPLMSEDFHQIDQELQKDPALYARTHLLSISFDPDYDTPKVLRSYGAAHTGRYANETFEHWEFAGGSPDEVKGVAQFFGLRYYHDTESGNDQVIHTLRTAVIGPDGKLYKLYRGNEWKPEDVLHDLKTLADEPSPSLAPAPNTK
jgi:protein SCO1